MVRWVVTSYVLLFFYLFPRSGILNEQYWVHIAGCRTIMSVGIVYFFSVR